MKKRLIVYTVKSLTALALFLFLIFSGCDYWDWECQDTYDPCTLDSDCCSEEMACMPDSKHCEYRLSTTTP
ncbi:MAG: hypothetical protein OEZ36_03810 [Spirochaetota bacterium]|nr:hypothetical protein [Spirochaetota bacterium]